jgi:hypothetical protein
MSGHTWVEVRRRARDHIEAGAVLPAAGQLAAGPRHARPAMPSGVQPVPVQARNGELVRAFAALLDADDAFYGQGHSDRVLATAREMALRAVLPA